MWLRAGAGEPALDVAAPVRPERGRRPRATRRYGGDRARPQVPPAAGGRAALSLDELPELPSLSRSARAGGGDRPRRALCPGGHGPLYLEPAHTVPGLGERRAA